MAKKVSKEEIEEKRSKNGGWSKEVLTEWGVPWPPPKHWKRALILGWPMPETAKERREKVAKKHEDKRKKGAKKFRIDAFYSTKEWKQVRYLALKQCGARCQCCGASAADGARLNVDHIKPRGRYPELALHLSNLQVLCGACNAGKGGWDETDWREPHLVTLMGERVDWRKA